MTELITPPNLDCSICLNLYKSPKVLPCGDTVCQDCILQIQDSDKVRCPYCQAVHRVPDEGFPENVAKQRTLETTMKIPCADCKMKEILVPCAHCRTFVCVECRARHIRLYTSLSLCAETMLGLTNISDSTEKYQDQKLLEKVNDELERTPEIFAAVRKEVDEREATYTNSLRTLKLTLENRILGGNQEAAKSVRHKLDNCELSQELASLGNSMRVAGDILKHERDGHVEFSAWFDMDGLKQALDNFGSLQYGDTTVEVPRVNLSEEEDAGTSLPWTLATIVEPADPEPRANLPHGVDYEAKSMSLVRVLRLENMQPAYAVYSEQNRTVYCTQGDTQCRSLLAIPLDKNPVRHICPSISNPYHVSRKDTGHLMITNYSSTVTVVDVTSESVTQVLDLSGRVTRAVFAYSHAGQFVVLDCGKPWSGDKRLVKFTKHGSWITEFGRDELAGTYGNSMCVDDNGQIYVSAGYRILDRKDTDDFLCNICRTSRSADVTWENRIVVFTWQGEFKEEFFVCRRTQRFEYGTSGKCRHKHPARADTSLNDQRLVRRLGVHIHGLSVDGDGYLSLTPCHTDEIHVLDPAHDPHCLIGGHGDQPGRFWWPGGLHMTPDGRYVICDRWNKRVQIF